MSATRLLATDLDGTFIGDDAAMHALWDTLEAQGIRLAFSTGRHLQSIHDFYTSYAITRRADACVCMVGTDLWIRRSGKYELDAHWHAIIGENWNKATVEQILREIPEARLQEAQWQSAFKSSYFLEENADERLAEIHRRLHEAGVAAKVVYSAGKFLDLLPAGSGKGEAVRYLAEQLEIDPANVIACGDTGNDLDMMRRELGFRAIAVGNATQELRAFREPHVYHARANHAAGIREGLQHYGWLPGDS